MNEKIEKQIQDILASERIMPEDIPDIGLYMDQVTTFMDDRLESEKRYPDDKIMTKTMINNYTKNHLLPPSLKKKYSRKHMMLIIMIYYLKNMLSITDIKTVMEPLNDRFFNVDSPEDISIEDIYRHVTRAYEDRREETVGQLMGLLEQSREEFSSPSLTEKDQRYLNDLSMICGLSFDIYVRKRLMEKLIDNFREDYPDGKKKKKPSK